MTMTKKLSNAILQKLRDYYGPVKPGLDYTNIYQLTISVVLSAQTTDKQVNKITQELFTKYPDFKNLAQAKLSDVEKIIRSTGFYSVKAKNIVNLSKMVVDKFNNILPDKLSQLTTLPGIGRKSANVILSQGYNVPAFAVDTHVTRLSNRLGYISSKDPLKIEKKLTAIIDKQDWSEGHLLFIHHGRQICRAQNPFCEMCPINDLCLFPDKNVKMHQ